MIYLSDTMTILIAGTFNKVHLGLGVVICGVAGIMHGIITDNIIVACGSLTFTLAVIIYDGFKMWI